MREVVAVKKWQVIERHEWLGSREELHERRGIPHHMYKPSEADVLIRHLRIDDYCG